MGQFPDEKSRLTKTKEGILYCKKRQLVGYYTTIDDKLANSFRKCQQFSAIRLCFAKRGNEEFQGNEQSMTKAKSSIKKTPQSDVLLSPKALLPDGDNPAASLAFQKLLDKLASGAIACGEPIREARLASEFGINRSAVREALNQMVGLELMEYTPYSGYRVIPFTLREALDWSELRLCLEPAALRFADGRHLEALQAEMQEILDIEERCIAQGDRMGGRRCDICFHLKLVECAHNRRMSSVFLRGALLTLIHAGTISRQMDQAEENGSAANDLIDQRNREGSHSIHRRILKAYVEDSIDEAIALLTRHLEVVCKRIRFALMDRAPVECAGQNAGIQSINSVVGRLLDGYRMK